MVLKFIGLATRLFYVALAVVGGSMVASAYPPSGGDIPLLLLVGAGLVVVGLAGAVWPDKMRSGSSGTE